jgi:hypothetical protein
LVEALKLSEGLIARLVLAKRPLSPLRSLVMSLMGSIDGDTNPAGLREALAARTSSLPDDAELRNAMLTMPYQGAGVTGSQLGAIFRAIERKLAGSVESQLPYGDAPSSFIVERIFPVTCRERVTVTWKDDFKWGRDADEIAETMSRTQEAVDNIGNLTLLTKRANAYSKSKAFGAKRRLLAGDDDRIAQPVLKVNRPILKKKRWTVAEIDERSGFLFEQVRALWPDVCDAVERPLAQPIRLVK